MLRLVLASIGTYEDGERGNTYHEKGDIRGILRKEPSEGFFCVCAYGSEYQFVFGVAGRRIQEETVCLTVTTELKLTSPCEESSRMKVDRASDDINRPHRKENKVGHTWFTKPYLWPMQRASFIRMDLAIAKELVLDERKRCCPNLST